jgi:small GTP-binding protein
MEVKAFSLAILGDSHVGKTCFANRLAQNPFNINEKPTIGADYFQKIYFYNNQTIKLDIYGTSGNDRYNKISKYLYKDARSIILMYNITDKKSFNNLNKYLDNIKQFSVENPIIYIVGNYLDTEKNKRQVSKEALKTFAADENLKSFEISCKTGDNVNELLMELTKDIIVSDKWYSSKIFKDLADINAVEKAEKENDKLKKSLKHFNKEKKPNYLRCQGCDQLFNVKFYKMFNEVTFICNKCNIKLNVPIEKLEEFMESLSNRIICFECKKKNDSKYKLNYCAICNKYICTNCEKIHDKKIIKDKEDKDKKHYLCPYYLMDIACYKDIKKNIGYCKVCKKSFCSKCNNEHRKHEFMYFDDFIEQLTKESQENIQTETRLINEFKNNCEDCLNTLRDTIYYYINMKEKEIKLKEQMISQLNNIQYNYQLIETVKNLRYLKRIKYDKKSSWQQKLMNIFEVLCLPIEIKSINISKNSKDPNTILSSEKIRLDYKMENNSTSEIKEITDVCNMNNDKCLGVTFNNGSLELFDNLIKSKYPLSVFQIFENGQSINSIHKSIRNINNFYLCGQYKIKNIEFYENYKSYKTINEIIDEEKIFELCLEQNDYLITSDVYNRIELFTKQNNKKLEDISFCIDSNCNKKILSFNEISNDKIYITFNKLSENKDGIIRGTNAMMGDIDDFTIDLSEEGNTFNRQQIELGTKIIELNYNRIKREYLLPDNQEVLGVLNNRLILIKDEINNSVILFDSNTFKNTQRFFLDLIGKPIYLNVINRRHNLIDFILVDDKMNIFHNILDEEIKNITQISGLKNKNDALEYDPEKIKRGKIIHNPFKSIVNYIGENEFIVVNY